MRKLAVPALLALFSTSAWSVPTHFEGTYDVTYADADPGLVLEINPAGGPLSFDLEVGQSKLVNLFTIKADESAVNSDDLIPVPLIVDFAFTLPSSFGGPASGSTWGVVSGFLGHIHLGVLQWDNGGHFALSFGNGGVLDVYLNDALFSEGVLWGLGKKGANVKAEFRYSQAPVSVPEPGLLTLMGFGLLGVGFVRRRLAA